MRRLFSRTFLVLSATALLAVHPASGQDSPLAGAAFMAGCWRGSAGQGRSIEETYLSPSRNLMQGMTRYTGPRGELPGPFTLDYEFTLLDVDGNKTRLRPHPRGQASGMFTEVERGPGRMVWADPTHDFPQKISYASAPGDSLIARIEGPGENGPRAIEWRMGRVPCPG